MRKLLAGAVAASVIATLAFLLPVLGVLPPALDAQAATLRASVYSGVKALYKGTATVGGTAELQLPLPDPQEFTSGTGNFQSDLLYVAEGTVGASSSTDIDLAGGVTDPFGATVTMVEITAVYIEASCANTNNVVIGNATQAVPLGFGGTNPTFALQPCGRFLVTAPMAGWSVGAGATDDLKIANSGSGTTVAYKIVVFGRSA